jgi:hypothetical protein
MVTSDGQDLVAVGLQKRVNVHLAEG